MRHFVTPCLVLGIVVLSGRLAHAELVAHWPLDDSGADVVGGYDGVEDGGVFFGVPGANANTGTATEFDGGVIDVPFAEELNPESFTIALWAQPTGGSGHRSPITSRYDGHVFGGGNLDGYILYANPNDDWQFWTGDGEDVEDFWDVLQGPPIEYDVWQHMAMTFDADTAEKTLYVDGELVASTTDQFYAPVNADDDERLLHLGGGGDDGTSFRWIGEIDDVGLWNEALTQEQIVSIMENGVGSGGGPVLQPGDADMDLDFDQLDLVQVQVAAKYLAGQPATWGEGDWNGGPGGEPGNPPTGDGLFDQLDIIAALSANVYLKGPYAALAGDGQIGDGQTSVVYNATSGEVSVDAPAGIELTSINIDSASGIFTGAPAENLGGSFDNDADNNIFKATFGGSFGSLSFGNVASPGLSQELVLGDLTVVGSLAGGGDLGAVDLVYIPEPSTAILSALALIGLLGARWRSRN